MPRFDEEDTVTNFEKKTDKENQKTTKVFKSYIESDDITKEFSAHNNDQDETKEFSTYNKNQDKTKAFESYIENEDLTKEFSVDNEDLNETKVFSSYNKEQNKKRNISNNKKRQEKSKKALKYYDPDETKEFLVYNKKNKDTIKEFKEKLKNYEKFQIADALLDSSSEANHQNINMEEETTSINSYIEEEYEPKPIDDFSSIKSSIADFQKTQVHNLASHKTPKKPPIIYDEELTDLSFKKDNPLLKEKTDILVSKEEDTDILNSEEEETDVLTSENKEEETNILLKNNKEQEDIYKLPQISKKIINESNKKLVIKMLIIFFVFLLTLFVYSVINNNNKREKKLKILKERKIELLKERIINANFVGINKYKLKKWDSAINYFDKVIALKPDHKEAQKYKNFAIIEKKNEVIFKNIKQLMLEDKYLSALTEIKKISDTSSYYDDTIKLKKISEEKLAQKEKIKKEEEKIKAQKEKELKKKIAKKKKIKKRKRARKRKRKRKRVSYRTDRYAKRLYYKAYRNERRYPKYSRKTYKKIMSMLPSSYYLYKQAKRRLRKLK